MKKELADIDGSEGWVNEHGLTAKQEEFAQQAASGAKLSDAYRNSYDAEGSSSATIHSEASRLNAHPLIAARIRELLRLASEKMLRDAVSIRRHVANGLYKESVTADKAGDRIKALIALGSMDVVDMFNAGSSKALEERKPGDILADLRAKLEGMVPMADDS